MADILMVTAIAGGESCAAVLSRQFQLQVDTAASRREAVVLLKRRAYQIVIVDESMVDADEDGTDALFRHCGTAVPLEINFAISGCGRVLRAVRAALTRREQEKNACAHGTTLAMKSQLREMVSGLLLHSELALAEPGLPESLTARLRTIVEMAGSLRDRLEDGQPPLRSSLPGAMSLSASKHPAGAGLKTAGAREAHGTLPPGGVLPAAHPSIQYGLASRSQ